jgi:TRAP-type C4-dicarboxylate transport system permease small subunit
MLRNNGPGVGGGQAALMAIAAGMVITVLGLLRERTPTSGLPDSLTWIGGALIAGGVILLVGVAFQRQRARLRDVIARRRRGLERG